MKEEDLARIQEKSDRVLAEDAQLDPEEPYYLALEVPDLLKEVRQLQSEVAGYRAAICFEVTCVGCARMLDQLAQFEAERDLAKQLRNDAKWLFDDFAWEEHWRYCDLPEGECDNCTSLVEMKARYGWE
jgi:hypothetical protein